jgi:hypothetical protein
MSKNKKNDDFADWQVHFQPSGGTTWHSPVIRASAVSARDGWLWLEDASGASLFAAPHAAVLYVKRLEPGTDRPVVAPHELALPAPFWPVNLVEPDLPQPDPVPAGAADEKAAEDPGPIETGPAARKADTPRPRSSRRGK